MKIKIEQREKSQEPDTVAPIFQIIEMQQF